MGNPKIRMLTAIGGDDFSLSGNEETTRFPARECHNLVDKGMAEWVDGPPAPRKSRAPVETATRKAPESRLTGAPSAKARKTAVQAISDAVVAAVRAHRLN